MTPLSTAALATDFDDLASIERVQQRHRVELARRQAQLEDEQRTCEELENHISRRLTQLMQEATLLEAFVRELAHLT